MLFYDTPLDKMTIKQIENTWLQNFKKSPLITDGLFNPSIARQLYYGPDENSDLPFKEGFRDFNDNCDISKTDKNLDNLLQYLHFIGVTISKKSITDGIARGTTSYQNILKKAFYILKKFATYDEELDIEDPYHDNMGDLFFFLRIQEGDNGQVKQLTLFDELELPEFYNKYIELPTGYENDKTAQKLFDLIENSDKSIFLTGEAGTGKSTFIHYFIKRTEKSALLVAFTGIAAVNIGGQTIHSFFRFPLKPLLPNDPDIIIFKPFFQKRKILEQTDTIIIDEVSMLRSDILEGLDYSLRMNGGNPNKIFGGKQLILVGDIFQLPPIIDNADEVESELFKSIYDSEYFFDSIAYKQLNPETFEFNKVHRQSNEQFISLLNKVRDCSIDSSGIEELNKRYNPSYIPKPEEFVITLTTNNYLAKTENLTKLNSLPYKSHFFKANITGDFREDKYPTNPILEIRRNSQIILVRNDSVDKGRRWVNGVIAKVNFIDNEKIEIGLKDGSVHTLQKQTWENRQYQWDKIKGRITSKVIGTFEQYPIKLAWAITIHKSQGLTFDNVIIDLGSGAFVNGQLYTALSRCRTFEGLTLKKRIQRKDIIEDKRLIEFYNDNILKKSLSQKNFEFYEREYDKYLETYLKEEENWNKKEEELGGGCSWNDMNEPLMSFDQFKVNYLKGSVPSIMKSDGGIINELDSTLSYKLSWSFLVENGIFFNQLFSTHYSFTEKDLIEFEKKLSVGSPYKSIDSGAIQLTTEYGLIFNENIEWSKKLREIYYSEPTLIYAGGRSDEYSFSIDFEQLPLNLFVELSHVKSNLHDEIFIDEEGYFDSNLYDSYFDFIIKRTEFTDIELIGILQKNNRLLYISSKPFYTNFLKFIEREIQDFSIEKFYEKYKNSTQ